MPLQSEKSQRTLLLAIVGIAVAAALAVTGWLLGRTAVPSELEAPNVVTSVTLSYQDFDDARSADLAVRLQPSPGMVARGSGLLTASTCIAGAAVVSGKATFIIDRIPVINLFTPQPLSRILSVGDKGEDVREIQEAFAAIGFHGTADGVVGAQTIAFFNDLRRATASDAPRIDAIDPANLIWLPEASQQAVDCPVGVGSSVDPGMTLANLPASITSLRVGTMPSALPTAPRVVDIGGVTASLTEDGAVDPEFWSDVAATSDFRAYVADPDSVVLSGDVRLRDSVNVAQVPPSALFGLAGDTACVSSGRATFAGTVVSSSLGFTLVQFSDERPTEVDLAPPASRTCP